MKQHRNIPPDHQLKSVTISQTPSGKYYASVLFEYDNPVEQVKPRSFLGLDFSMRELYVDSNGDQPQYPRYYQQVEKRLKQEQRKLSHMKKDSNNRHKQRIRVAKLHEKATNQRKDFLHKQSRKIANSYDCVCIESLDMKATAQSLHFGKSVSDSCGYKNPETKNLSVRVWDCPQCGTHHDREREANAHVTVTDPPLSQVGRWKTTASA